MKMYIALALVFGSLASAVFSSKLTAEDHHGACTLNLSFGLSCFKESGFKQRHLELLHITKTGGTSLEEVAFEGGINWGFRKRDHIYKHSSNGNSLDGSCSGAEWHWPLEFFQKNPYKATPATDLFTVVRNPYSRVISEYRWEVGYYRSLRKHRKSTKDSREFFELIQQANNAQSPVVLNKYIQRRLAQITEPCSHYRPQASYLFSKQPKSGLMIENILRFENLQTEFNRLMEIYGLDLSLNESTIHQRAGVSFIFSVDDLWDTTKELIYSYYKDDFLLLGYPK